jgi:hypothetical protein
MATQRERDDLKREQKRKDMEDAIDQGRLVIRPMTDAERAANPPRERPEPRRRGRRKP